MSRRRRERVLKRAVADLARLHPDDVEAILGALDADEKARVDKLVAGLAGGPPAASAPPQEPVWTYEGVSLWLVDRIDPDARAGGRAGRDFVLMTPASADALRAAAAPFRTRDGGRGRPGATLLDRAIDFLSGART
jgi:hypothetical protein